MKTIKNVKVKTTKTAAKVSAPKARAAIRPAKPTPAPAAAPQAVVARPAPQSAPKPAAIKPRSAPRPEITSDLIAARAYILWEQQGRPHGGDLANWLLAESQLKQEIQSLAE